LAVLKILYKCTLGPLLLADVIVPTERFWAREHATQPLPLFIEYVIPYGKLQIAMLWFILCDLVYEMKSGSVFVMNSDQLNYR
jgi:hypothetical protein